MPKEEPVAGVTPKERIPLKDWWALIISVAALIVSGLSWWDSHESARLVNAKTYRRLKTIDAFLNYTPGPSPNASLVLLYQNVGELPIKVLKAGASFSILETETDANKACLSDLHGRDFDTKQSIPKQTEIKGPGDAVVLFDWPKSCAGMQPALLLGLSYTGEDSLGHDFGEDDGARLKYGSKGIDTSNLK